MPSPTPRETAGERICPSDIFDTNHPVSLSLNNIAFFKSIPIPPPPPNGCALDFVFYAPLPLFLQLSHNGDSIISCSCFFFPLLLLIALPSLHLHPLGYMFAFFVSPFSYRKMEDVLVSLLTGTGARKENTVAKENISLMP